MTRNKKIKKSSATLFAASRRSQINVLVEVITPPSAHDIINVASFYNNILWWLSSKERHGKSTKVTDILELLTTWH